MIKYAEKLLAGYGINSKKIILCIFLLVLGILLLAGTNSEEPKVTQASFEGEEYTSSLTDTEQKLCNILSKIQGVESVDVMVTYSDDNENESSYWGTHNKESSNIQGVVVVAQGAEDAHVKSDIIYAVSVLLNVELCDIRVYPVNN